MKQVLVAFALIMGAFLALWGRASGSSRAVHRETATTAPESQPSDAVRVVISMLYSPEKEGWIEWAQDEYVRKNPNVQIKLTPMGSVLAIDAILTGAQKPTIWSPESMLELRDVAERWKKQTGRSLFSSDPAYAPEKLLKTALVLVAWESRAKAIDEYLRKNDGKNAGLWKRLVEASAAQEGWKGLDGPAAWGPIKFGYPDPLKTGLGLWTVYLACLDELNGDSTITPAQLDAPSVKELMRSIAPGFPFPTTPKDIVTQMEQFGPSRYDMVVTYETLALEAIKTPKERWERLVIYYPSKLVWSDHPAAVLELDGVTDEQKKAGLQWIHYLKSHEVQRKALSYGFRPTDETIPLSANPSDNAFVALSQRMSERVKSEQVIPAPEGDVVEKLLEDLRVASDQL